MIANKHLNEQVILVAPWTITELKFTNITYLYKSERSQFKPPNKVDLINHFSVPWNWPDARVHVNMRQYQQQYQHHHHYKKTSFHLNGVIKWKHNDNINN